MSSKNLWKLSGVSELACFDIERNVELCNIDEELSSVLGEYVCVESEFVVWLYFNEVVKSAWDTVGDNNVDTEEIDSTGGWLE